MPDKRPFDLLNEMLNKEVVLAIKGNKVFKGKLISYDIHMNLELFSVKERKDDGSFSDAQISKMLIRGDSIVYVYME